MLYMLGNTTLVNRSLRSALQKVDDVTRADVKNEI